MMETNDDIKLVLGQLTQVVALLCDETSELVDKCHRPGMSDIGLVAIRDRSLALSQAADALRLTAKTILGIEDQSESFGVTK